MPSRLELRWVNICRSVAILSLIMFPMIGTRGQSAAKDRLRATLPRIEAGTRVGDADQPRWNRVVLLAKPRIASGDKDSVPSFVGTGLSRFVLTLLATVEAVPAEPSEQDPTPRYRLTEVGIGHSAEVEGKLVVITPADYESHGVDISFLQRQILSENQRHFDDIQLVVRTSALLMFDVPALLHRDGKHEDFVMRHLIWIDSRTGQLFTLFWLLEKVKTTGPLRVVDSEPLYRWDANQVEDRAIHVDANEFTLGIPGRRAFALERMPPGHAIPWTEELKGLASQERYDKDSLRAFLVNLNDANRQTAE